METNLKAFMKPELKERKTMEFPGIDKYVDADGKPIPFIIKKLTQKELGEIRDLYRTTTVYRDKQNGDRPVITADGQVAVIRDYDSDRAGRHIMVDAFVQPKLDAPELMKYYGVYDRVDMPWVVFPDKEDFRYADECLSIALGFKEQKTEKGTIEQIKN